MRILYGIFLTIIYICIIVFNYRRTRDLFNPLSFYSILRIIFVLPGIYIRLTPISYYNEELLPIYIIYELLSLIFISLGIIFYNSLKNKRKIINIIGKYQKNFDTFGIVQIAIGVLSVIYLVINSGGLSYIYQNINLRSFMLRGQGYVNLLGISTNIGIVSYAIYYFKNKNKINVNVRFFCLLFIASLSKIAFGARTPLLSMIMLLLIAYNYHNKRFKIKTFISIKNLIVVGLSFLFIVMFPMIRNNEMRDLYNNPREWVDRGIQNFGEIANEFTIVDRDIFVIDYFKNNQFWVGKGYVDLLYSPIPSSIFSNKPPVDDGVYLANLIKGYDISPSMPFKDIPFKSSVPFTQFGILYANLGFIGLIFGMFFTGFIYQFTYKIVNDTKFDIFSLIIYQVIMYTFKFSNLAISMTLQTIIFTLLCFKLFGSIKFKKTRIVY